MIVRHEPQQHGWLSDSVIFVAIVCALFMLPLEQSVVAQTIALDEADGYERYREVQRNLRQLRTTGTVTQIRWTDDGSGIYFTRDGNRFRFDLDELIEEEADSQMEAEEVTPKSERRRPIPPRGRQRDREPSPCGRWIARCVDWNVMIEPTGDDEVDANQREMIVVTTDGTRKHRFGKASWVYGEELRQRDAMWWSPCSRYLAYYDLDERQVPDYYLTDGLTELRTEVLIEGYPKAGDPNPIAKLWIYDLETEESIKVHTHEDDDERYIYRVQFAPNGSELIFHRTNRWQNVLELIAADATTGAARVILTETQEAWQNNRPTLQFLNCGERFVWASERTGWEQYELRHLNGGTLAQLSNGEYPVRAIEHVDEEAGVLYYTAYCPEYPLNVHLYRVNLDGTERARMTSRPGHLTVDVAPGGDWFIARYQAINEPPVTKLHRSNGDVVEVFATADTARFEELALTMPETLELIADDGETTLYGVMFKPSGFDPTQSYPLVVDVYGGPHVQRVRNTWQAANPACEFGMIIVTVDNRGTPNRGKAFEAAIYRKLGIVDLADQVAAVKQLLDRPYVDETRVGIYGHSYGGYLSALGILKHPELFHVAVAGGAVTDWRNYDTIYTERYMRTPEENAESYEKGSCVTYADQLEGKLLILHGMLDDNVHPANAWQLADALQREGRRFDMMMYPRAGHGLSGHAMRLRLEYLINHLPAGAQLQSER